MPEHPLEVEPEAVRDRLAAGDDPLLLDCREPDEYELVHLSGATLLPMSEIAGRAAELEPHRGREIVVYCHHGGRSLRVTHWLRRQGFDAASSLAGGIDGWAVRIDPSLPRY